MRALNEQYLTNHKGQRKAVVLPYSAWEKLLDILEEYEEICAYDKAKTKKSHPIPFEKVLKKIKHG